jgi:hypothetical protein
VSVDQLSHQFLFGCGAFDAVDLMKTQDAGKKAFLQERMDKWLALFNYGTLPFYWGRYEPEEGKTAKEETLQAAHYLRDRGVTLKGHPLCWHTACAPWLLKYSNEEIMRRQLDRITRDVTEKKGVTKDDSVYRAKVIALNDGHGYVLVYREGSDEKQELVYKDRVAPDTGDSAEFVAYAVVLAAAACALAVLAAVRRSRS